MSSKPIEIEFTEVSEQSSKLVSLDETLSVTHFQEEVDTSSEPSGEGVVIGHFVGWNDQGCPQIELPGKVRAIAASSIAKLAAEDVGCEVALLFQQGDQKRPVIMGKILEPHFTKPNEMVDLPGHFPSAGQSEMQAESDGERLVLEAEKEIVLKCGKSSITLTRAGKVLIRGAFLLSRSSGVNRIKGGSVQIN